MCLLFALLCSAGCAAWPFKRNIRNDFAPPQIYSQTPSKETLIAQINNSLQIQRLQSNTLTISSSETIAKLRGHMQWERPDRFSMQAHLGTRALGVQMSAGSNPEMFWFQSNNPPTMFYASHTEFANYHGPKHILPVSPLWLREAIGVVEFADDWVTEEPILRADQKIELKTYIPAGNNQFFERHLVVNPKSGVIEETRLYNPASNLVAVAQMFEHEYYSAVNFSLPHRVEIQLHPDASPYLESNVLAFTVEISMHNINGPPGPADAFKPPDTTGMTEVNLVEFDRAQETGPAFQPVGTPPQYTPALSSSYNNDFDQLRR